MKNARLKGRHRYVTVENKKYFYQLLSAKNILNR